MLGDCTSNKDLGVWHKGGGHRESHLGEFAEREEYSVYSIVYQRHWKLITAQEVSSAVVKTKKGDTVQVFVTSAVSYREEVR